MTRAARCARCAASPGYTALVLLTLGVPDAGVSVRELADYRAQVTSLDAVVEYHQMWFNLLGQGDASRVQTVVSRQSSVSVARALHRLKGSRYVVVRTAIEATSSGTYEGRARSKITSVLCPIR